MTHHNQCHALARLELQGRLRPQQSFFVAGFDNSHTGDRTMGPFIPCPLTFGTQVIEAIDPVRRLLSGCGHRDDYEAWLQDVDDRVWEGREGNMANARRNPLQQPGTSEERIFCDESNSPLDLVEESIAQARDAAFIPIARFGELEAGSVENFKHGGSRRGREPGRALHRRSRCVRCRRSAARSVA